MRHSPRLVAALLSAFIAVVALPGHSSAQSATTAAVTGQVTSTEGQPLAGVQIVVTNTQRGGTFGVLTRSDGRYLLPGLPPGGGYTVQARALGYATQVFTDVNLAISQTQKFDFQLAPEAVAVEGIAVTAERGAVISKDRMGTSTVVSDSAISRLPTITRDFTDFARLSPQISTGGAGASAAGRNNRYNSIQIDGSVNNDLFGLASSGTPGGQAGARPISLDAIQEFQVVLSPTDVRQGGFTGAGINAVTKSGTNELHGAVFFYNKNDALVGEYETQGGELSGDYPEFGQNEIGASLGGPIIKDRLHFFVNGEINRREAPIGVVPGQGDARVSLQEAQEFANVLQNYGYDPGPIGALDLGRESNLAFGRLDWNISPNHRFTLRHNYVDAFDDNLSRSNTSYYLGNYLYAFNSVTNSTVAQLNSTLSSRLFNEFRFGYQTIRDERQVADPRPSVRVNLSGGRRLYGGSDQFSGANSLDQDAIQLSNDLTIALGRHNLTIGTQNEFYRFDNLFVRNVFGYYEFASVDSLRQGIPSRYEYSYQLPGGERSAEFPVHQYAVYAQDQINVTDDLTVSAGLRLDYTNLPESPGRNPEVEQFYDRNTSEVPTSLLFNPRLGFNWNVGGLGVTQLRGGIGLYSGRTPGVWISNAYGNSGLDYARFTCSTAGQIPAFNPDPDQQATSCLGSTRLAANEINTIDPDFEMPQVWRANFAVDRQLPADFTLTLEGLYTGVVNDIVYRDLSVGAPTGAIVEGRAQVGRNTPAPTIGNVFELASTDQGYSYSLTAGLSRRFLDRFSLDASYTFSRAEDVNPGTSSQASSNFRFLPVAGDPNNPELRTSDYEVPNRIVVAGSYQLPLGGRFATDLSLIYVGENGRPFSFTYSGDVNADRQFANDLIYVPASAAEVRFAGTAAEQAAAYQALEQFINRFDCLQDARGEVLQRNACREPWQNRLDFRASQVLPTLAGQNLQLTVDVLNILNLVNSDWGKNQFVQNGEFELLDVESSTPQNGRVLLAPFEDGNLNVYELGDLSSRYQIQIGLRYAF